MRQKNTLAGGLGGPQARPRGGGTPGVNRPAIGPSAQPRARQSLGGTQAKPMRVGHKPPVAAASQSNGMLPVNQYFGAQAQAGLGQAKTDGVEGYLCLGCKKKLLPRVNDYERSPGDGPYCAECLTGNTRITHPMYNLPNRPPCVSFFRWRDHKFNFYQQKLGEYITKFTQRVGTYPTPQQVDAFLSNGQFHRTEPCPNCAANITFHPLSGDFNLPGINAPLPPQQQMQQQMQGVPHVHGQWGQGR